MLPMHQTFKHNKEWNTESLFKISLVDHLTEHLVSFIQAQILPQSQASSILNYQ